MSKNSDVVKVSPIAPTMEIPMEAPKPGFDLGNPDLSIIDLFPENFFSMDGLQAILDVEAGHSVALTVAACHIEYVFDPAKGEASGEWKPVLSFEETGTKLILNKTRAQVAQQLTGSPLVRAWAGLGQISIRPGIKDGHAQILLEPLRRARANGNGRKAEIDPQDDIFAD
jgi:hypothetical protein